MKKLFKQLRYIIEYIILICIVNLSKLVSIDKAANFWAKICSLIGPYLKVSKLAKANMSYVNLPNKHEQILREAWDNLGRFFGEFAHIKNIKHNKLKNIVHIMNEDIITNLINTNKPFILFTGHFANWDLMLALITKYNIKFGVVYRKANNPYIDKFIRQVRSHNNIILVEKGPHGHRSLLNILKARIPIIMLVDQRMNEGIEVDFLGKPAMTADAIARCALKFDYNLLPAQIIRLNKSTKFKVIFQECIEIDRTDNNHNDILTIMLEINLIIADWVRSYPSQWFWFHNRWGLNLKSQLNNIN